MFAKHLSNINWVLISFVIASTIIIFRCKFRFFFLKVPNIHGVIHSLIHIYVQSFLQEDEKNMACRHTA